MFLLYWFKTHFCIHTSIRWANFQFLLTAPNVLMILIIEYIVRIIHIKFDRRPFSLSFLSVARIIMTPFEIISWGFLFFSSIPKIYLQFNLIFFATYSVIYFLYRGNIWGFGVNIFFAEIHPIKIWICSPHINIIRPSQSFLNLIMVQLIEST